MKIPYCTCEKHSKEIFSTGFLIFGITVHILVGGAIILLLFSEPLNLVPLLAVAILWTMWGWNKLEYRRQALFLQHSQKCAQRYSTLAAFATFGGSGPEYGKLTGYKSLARAIAEKLFGESKAKRLFSAMAALGATTIVVLIAATTYDGLTRQRNGLPNHYSKYSPGISESTWSAILLPALALLVYFHFEKRTNRKKLLAFSIAAGTVPVWLGLTYTISWYARMDFWTNVGGAILILCVAIAIVFVLMVLENLWRKRKRKTRRRKA